MLNAMTLRANVPKRIRWAARLSPRLLERLYQSDARRFLDLELCDDVGFRLYARCRSFLLVQKSEVECPICGTVFAVRRDGESACLGDSCDWSTTRAEYRESVRNHYAHTGRAVEAYERFHSRFPGARSYSDKILLIDELIHSFHIDERRERAVKSVASKLLEGNKNEVVRFLDRLSALDPAEKERWRQTVSGTIHGHVVSGARDQDDSEGIGRVE
jgi:hypothetical protein